MLLKLLYVLSLATAVMANQGPSTFSASELEFLATLELCKHFRGSCGQSCPFRYIRHRWNIPLCPSRSMECCIGPAPTTPENGSSSSAAPGETPTATTTTPSTSSPSTTTATTTTTTTTTTTLQAESAPAVSFQGQTDPRGSCGFVPSSATNGVLRKRIVGGTLAAPGRWPWLVALRSMLGSHACSGALIGARWIVTAAHCFKHISNPSLWRVRIGEYDLLTHDPGEIDVHIENIIVNPAYGTQRTGQPGENQTLYTRYVNDIAIVQLRLPVQGVEPICLPASQQTDQDHEECWVAGWGVTMDQMNEDQRLRQVSGPVVPNPRCSEMWDSPLEENMMCFGDGTYGPCSGDSGGPLSCRNPQGRYVLEGVVSWGTEDCNLSGYPSVFTRVRPYADWIRQHLLQDDAQRRKKRMGF